MKKILNNVKVTLIVMVTGTCLAAIIFVIAMILDINGSIDLKSSIDDIHAATYGTVASIEDNYNAKKEEEKQKKIEKKLEEYRIKELDNEYNKRLKELNDWYMSQR